MAELRIEGPTPAGGSYALGAYLDQAGNDAEPDAATQLIVREFSADGEMIAETFGLTSREVG